MYTLEKAFPIFVRILDVFSEKLTPTKENLILLIQSRKTSLWLNKHSLIEKLFEQVLGGSDKTIELVRSNFYHILHSSISFISPITFIKFIMLLSAMIYDK